MSFGSSSAPSGSIAVRRRTGKGCTEERSRAFWRTTWNSSASSSSKLNSGNMAVLSLSLGLITAVRRWRLGTRRTRVPVGSVGVAAARLQASFWRAIWTLYAMVAMRSRALKFEGN